MSNLKKTFLPFALLTFALVGCFTKPTRPPVLQPITKSPTQPAAPTPNPTNPPLADVSAETEAPAVPPPTGPFAQMFEARGVVRELKPDGKTVVIAHEEIPGYMAAMVMPFEVKEPQELSGLAAGDTVSFQLIVGATNGWIEQVKKLDVPRAVQLPPTLRVVHDVEPLKEGDLLPDYTFTNELGYAVNLAQFRGQALAITFIFTRCPFPNFCPQMSRNFAETQEILKIMKTAPTNWHLFSLSFDPEYDTPAVLKTYAENFHADPARWSFLTGALIDITAITEQTGLQFWRENPGEPISHNLRTVVVDTQGRVQKIIANNNWTSDELVAEMVKAAAMK